MKKTKPLKWISAEELDKKIMKNPEYKREYDKLETEYQVASQMIEARIKRKMSQEELAKKANTGQAVISRLEGMNGKPSISLLERVAKALQIKFHLKIG